MKVIRFSNPSRDVSSSEGHPPQSGPARVGLYEGDGIYDISAALDAEGVKSRRLAFADTPTLIGELGRTGFEEMKLRAPMASAEGVTLLAPVARPPKFMGIGLNYHRHVAEMGALPPAHQLWFNKQSTCVIGPGETIEIPPASDQVDYEGELAFVVGAKSRHVSRMKAHDVIFGYLICNDVTVRDWQANSPTFTMGKSFDTHGPIGPWIVTPDEIDDPQALLLKTWVNGELRQDSTTGDMIFGIGEMIEHLSTAFTLEPGDIYSTGTPEGVGNGFSPPKYLRSGDEVTIEVEGIGKLTNYVKFPGART